MDRDFQTGVKNADRPVPENDVPVEAALPLHPVDEHAIVLTNPNQSSLQSLEEFASFIAAMKEQDYGDWMRRANVYCDQLRVSLLASSNERDYIERQLAAMKKIIQYTPNWQVLETQRSVIDKVLEMRRHFGGGDELNIHDLDISTSMSTDDLH
jgi:hypothetical protein